MAVPAKVLSRLSPSQRKYVEGQQRRLERLSKNGSAKAAKRPLIQNGTAFVAGMADKVAPFTVEVGGMEFSGAEVGALIALGVAVKNGDESMADMATAVTCVSAYKAGQKAGDSIKSALGI